MHLARIARWGTAPEAFRKSFWLSSVANVVIIAASIAIHCAYPTGLIRRDNSDIIHGARAVAMGVY
jgi:hypothetical protein